MTSRMNVQGKVWSGRARHDIPSQTFPENPLVPCQACIDGLGRTALPSRLAPPDGSGEPSYQSRPRQPDRGLASPFLQQLLGLVGGPGAGIPGDDVLQAFPGPLAQPGREVRLTSLLNLVGFVRQPT